MRIPGILLASLSLGFAGDKTKLEKGKSEDIIRVRDEDPEMIAAMVRARETFDRFLAEQRKGDQDFWGLAKVYFTDKGVEDGEHMWVQITAEDDKRFKGILLSRPGWLKSVRRGQEVEFGRSDVSDWMYTRDGKAVGGYTVRVLRSRMSDEERAAHDANYPFSFD